MYVGVGVGVGKGRGEEEGRVICEVMVMVGWDEMRGGVG